MFGSGRKAMDSLSDQVRQTRDIAVRAETKVDSHDTNCIEHNRRIEEMLREGQSDRARQHAEGQASIEVIHGRVNSLSARMTTTLISALSAIVMALAGAVYAAVAHKIGM